MKNIPFPDKPPVEQPELLNDYLSAISAEPEEREFCQNLARDGLALIDLGADGRKLCDQAAQEVESYFVDDKVSRVQDAWLRSKAVRQLAIFPKVKRFLKIAYGRPSFAFQTLNFRVGTEQSIHSDAIHFHSIPERFMCGVWTALEDISPESGPLAYYAGSHRMPILTMKKAGVNHSAPSYSDYVSTYLPSLASRLQLSPSDYCSIAPKKGQAVVWLANLAHGGANIKDINTTRRSLVTHFFFDNFLYYTPMNSIEEDGKISVRFPPDIDTGLARFSRKDGHRIFPDVRQIKDTIRRVCLREAIAR